MANSQAQRPKKGKTPNGVIENLRQLGEDSVQSFTDDFLDKLPGGFSDQLFGPPPDNFKGDIGPGQDLWMNDVYSGKREEEEKLKGQLALERRLREEERNLVERKSSELRYQLKALMQEVANLAAQTENLAQEVTTASEVAPVNPGIYHVTFFEKLIEFIRSFGQKLENAALWLNSSNKRGQKKNYWAKYKQHGSKFLLSADHYLTRSAG